MRELADRHQWRMVTLLRLERGTDESTDPIKHLLEHVRILGADAVVVPERRHLSDMAGHDCLEGVCRVCFVATMSPEQQLWPWTIGGAALPTWPMS
ncbi:hypothetical protein [Nocardia sp. CA-135398]|uniref:hypothetical protein n=1 Tax=Nocardia sp. CA-135398 TaxID=3239977 RepID=UPI003D965735